MRQINQILMLAACAFLFLALYPTSHPSPLGAQQPAQDETAGKDAQAKIKKKMDAKPSKYDACLAQFGEKLGSNFAQITCQQHLPLNHENSDIDRGIMTYQNPKDLIPSPFDFLTRGNT